MKWLKIAIICFALLMFSASASALSPPSQFSSMMSFPVSATSLGSMNLFSSGLNDDNAVVITPVIDLPPAVSAFPASNETNGLQNDRLDNLLSTNNQNVATQTSSTTYQASIPTPTPTPTTTPTQTWAPPPLSTTPTSKVINGVTWTMVPNIPVIVGP
jgi:hypothetical protein